jgi:Tfp pilus assembly protein PilN
MEEHNKFLNAGGGWAELIGVAASFGLGFLTSKNINKEQEQLLVAMSELDDQQAERLRKALSTSITENAKTQVVYEFLDVEKAKKLEKERKNKLILPLIGLGFGVVLLGLIFYKLNKQNG